MAEEERESLRDELYNDLCDAISEQVDDKASRAIHTHLTVKEGELSTHLDARFKQWVEHYRETLVSRVLTFTALMIGFAGASWVLSHAYGNYTDARKRALEVNAIQFMQLNQHNWISATRNSYMELDKRIKELEAKNTTLTKELDKVRSGTVGGALTSSGSGTVTSVGAIQMPPPTTFTKLSGITGTIIHCTDCTVSDPCAGGGNGATAMRLTNKWVCK